MRHLLILISSLLLSQLAQAQLDLSYGAQGRSFPLSAGEAFVEAGYNYKFWEKENSNFKINPFFGLIRPSVSVNSSILVNSVKGEMEFFPISFLGVSFGKQKIESNFDFPFFDCEKIFCQLQFDRNWIEGKMALKYKESLFITTYREDNIVPSRHGKDFGEFRRVITGADGGDVMRELRIILGRNWDQKILGIVHEWAMFRRSRENSRTTFGVFQIKKEKNTYMIGAGTLESDQVGRGPIVYLRWTHQIFPTLKLF